MQDDEGNEEEGHKHVDDGEEQGLEDDKSEQSEERDNEEVNSNSENADDDPDDGDYAESHSRSTASDVTRPHRGRTSTGRRPGRLSPHSVTQAQSRRLPGSHSRDLHAYFTPLVRDKVKATSKPTPPIASTHKQPAQTPLTQTRTTSRQ